MSLRRRISAFSKEARRRRVYTSAVAYVAVSIALIELGGAIFEALLFPSWAPRLLTVLLMLGFPVVLTLAWIFDVGPTGVQRTDAEPRRRSSTPLRRLVRGGAAAAAPPPAKRRTPPPVDLPAEEAPDPERVRRATLAHMRHELRTPINAVIGYSEMLGEDAAAEGDRAAAADLARIREAGRQLLTLVDEILSPDKAADTERDLDSFAAAIRADLRNPINAIVGYTEMLIESRREAGADHDVADLERILGAAHRLLELSSDLVRFAAGPAAAAAAGSLPDASTVAEGVLAKLRPLRAGEHEDDRQGSLLIVDDNAMNRDLLSRQLARKGYLVQTAESGREALQRLETKAFDLVLLDIMMPEIDGIEVLRRVKAQPRLREMPIIMISSLDEIDSAIRCMELGAEDYLTKPFHPTLLDVRIGACLEAQRLREREAFYRSQLEVGDEMVEQVLRSAFPGPVVERMRNGDREIVDVYAEATVLACDLEPAARGGAGEQPAERAARMQEVYRMLESEAADHGIDMLVLHGARALLLAPTPEEAGRMLDAARTLLDDQELPTRFGAHTGAANAAIVGVERFSYYVWGDAVDVAHRLLQRAPAASLLASPTTHALLKDRFTFESRGVIDLEGVGQTRTYLLQSGIPAPR